MKRLMISCVLILFLLLSKFIEEPFQAQAKGKYVYHNFKYKINGITFVTKQYQKQGQTKYKIIMKQNGKRKTIAKDTGTDFVTNGKILYYVLRGNIVEDYSYYNTIYKYDIGSGRKTKIAAGLDYTVLGATDRYLYLGSWVAAAGVELYCYDLSTHEKTYMKDCVECLWIRKNRVITEDNTGSIANLDIASFKLDGTDRKIIAKGKIQKVTNKQVFYIVYDFNAQGYRYKKFVCSLTGKNKKAICKWKNI